MNCNSKKLYVFLFTLLFLIAFEHFRCYAIINDTYSNINKNTTICVEEDRDIIELKNTLSYIDNSIDSVNGTMNTLKVIQRKFKWILQYKNVDMDFLLYMLDKTEKYNIDPYVLFGLIKLESSFNPECANGSSSARGLGQFLKGTGKWVYEDLMKKGKGTYTHDLAYDKHINVEMSCVYLRYLLNTNNNDYHKALLAYNGYELGDKYYHIIMRNKRIYQAR